MIAHWRNSMWVRRAAFLLANISCVAGFWLFVVAPIQSFFADREARILEQGMLLSRLNAIVAQRAAVAELAAQSSTDGKRAEFLQGANDGAAAASLQTMVKGIVEPAGGRLRSVRALPTSVAEDMKFIGVQLEMTGTIHAVYQTIQAIGAAKPFLFIVGAQLRPTQRGPVTSPGSNAEPTIDARIDVVGAMQSEGGI
jgi:hypothetical protein